MKKGLAFLSFFFLSFPVSASTLTDNPNLLKADQLIQNALKSYESIDSYETLMRRQYPMGNKKNDAMFLRFEKPHNIYMAWEEGPEKGLQVFHARGKFDDKLLCRPPGFIFNFIPIVRLEKDDPRVASEEGHGIDRAGLGYFIEDLAQEFHESLNENKVLVQDIEEVRVHGEAAIQMTLHYDVPEWEYQKKIIAFSRKHQMPIYIELFNRDNELVEIYHYENIALNPNRQSEAFQSSIDRRLWDKYKTV